METTRELQEEISSLKEKNVVLLKEVKRLQALVEKEPVKEEIDKVVKFVRMSIPKYVLVVPVTVGAVKNTAQNLFESGEISLATYNYLIGHSYKEF